MLLTERQAADELQIDRRTLRKLIESGRLQAINVGGAHRKHYRVHPDALKAIVPDSPSDTIKVTQRRTHRHSRLRQASSTSAQSYLPTVSS
jgi:excisionase family DNA binding protein